MDMRNITITGPSDYNVVATSDCIMIRLPRHGLMLQGSIPAIRDFVDHLELATLEAVGHFLGQEDVETDFELLDQD